MELMPVLYVQACMSSIFNRVFTNIHPVVGHLIGCKHCSDRLFHECSFGSRVKPRWALNKKNWHWCWDPFFFSLFIELGISSQQVRMAFHSRGNAGALEKSSSWEQVHPAALSSIGDQKFAYMGIIRLKR